MKLYDVPDDTKIVCDCDDGSTFITFHHIDGMYSYCTTEKGGVAHLAAVQEIKKDGNTYSLTSEK